jgi:hypothetical protein
MFTDGLKKSLLNYMHAACFDYPLQKWFDFKVPKTSVQAGYIIKSLEEDEYVAARPTARMVWLGKKPKVELFTKSKKGEQWEMASLTFESRQGSLNIKTGRAEGLWLSEMLGRLSVNNHKTNTRQQVEDDYTAAGLEDFGLFWDNKPVNGLYRVGLLVL